MRRYAQTVLVFLLGATLLKLVFTGDYTRYVQPGFAVPLVLAGFALVAVAGVTLWRWVRALRLGSRRDEPVHTGVSEVEGIFGPYRLGTRDRAPHGRDAFQRDPFAADPFDGDPFDTNPHGPSERAEAAGWAAAEHEGTGNVLAARSGPAAAPVVASLPASAAGGDTTVVPAQPAGAGDTVLVPVLPAGAGDTVLVPVLPSGAGDTVVVPVVDGGRRDEAGIRDAAAGPTAEAGTAVSDLEAAPSAYLDESGEPDTLTTLPAVARSEFGAGLPAPGQPESDHREPDLPDPDLPDPDLIEAAGDGAAGGTGDGLRVGWLLLVAALILLVVAPPALGSFLATRADTVAVAAGNGPPLPAGVGPRTLSLTEYVAAARAGGASLADREVRLVGFVVAGAHGEPYLARLVVGCCAAGARPAWVGLTGDLPASLDRDRWVAVVGTYTDRVDHDPVNGQPVPYLNVVTIDYIDAPADPYES